MTTTAWNYSPEQDFNLVLKHWNWVADPEVQNGLERVEATNGIFTIYSWVDGSNTRVYGGVVENDGDYGVVCSSLEEAVKIADNWFNDLFA